MTDPDALQRLRHTIELVPDFHEIDAMEIVWHGHYVKYLERARDALLDRLGYGFREMRASGFAWPVVDMRMKYIGPATLGQRLAVTAAIVEWEARLRIDYRIADAATGRKLHQAHTIQVAVDLASGRMHYVCPPVLWQKLGVQP